MRLHLPLIRHHTSPYKIQCNRVWTRNPARLEQKRSPTSPSFLSTVMIFRSLHPNITFSQPRRGMQPSPLACYSHRQSGLPRRHWREAMLSPQNPLVSYDMSIPQTTWVTDNIRIMRLFQSCRGKKYPYPREHPTPSPKGLAAAAAGMPNPNKSRSGVFLFFSQI